MRCFPDCRRRRRRKENCLEGESDLHRHLPHADLPHYWHPVLVGHVEAAGDCGGNDDLKGQGMKSCEQQELNWLGALTLPCSQS